MQSVGYVDADVLNVLKLMKELEVIKSVDMRGLFLEEVQSALETSDRFITIPKKGLAKVVIDTEKHIYCIRCGFREERVAYNSVMKELGYTICNDLKLPGEESILVCHNYRFDGAIFSNDK